MNYGSLILFALFFTVLGFIMALLVARLREPDQTALSRIRKDRGVDEWQAPGTSGHPGSLQVWKDPESGKLLIELDEQVFQSISQLTPEQRKALGIRTGELVNWLSQAASTPASPAARPTRLQSQPSIRNAMRAEPTPGSPRSRGLLARTLQSNLKNETGRTTTLAAQVDEILQAKLAGSSLAGRNIRLIDLPNHGLAVEVGLDRFDSIDDVSDPEVRQILKEAVTEWQQRARREE